MRRRLLYPFVPIVLVLLFVVFPPGHTRPLDIEGAGATLHQSGRNLEWDLHLNGNGNWASEVALGAHPCLDLTTPQVHLERLCVSSQLGVLILTNAAFKPIPASFQGATTNELKVTFRDADVGVRYGAVTWQSTSPKLFAGALSLHRPRLVGCQVSGPNWVFNGPTQKRQIALTFDDGPSPDPPAMDFVKVLARYHARATFFEIGAQISYFDSSGSAERAMLADGDMIGDHTWSHPDMTKLPPAEQTSELREASQAIRQKTGFTPCLFRAPYGDADPQLLSLARGLGYATIQWNIDTDDWETPGVAKIVHAAVSAAKPGGIIIMHFGGGLRYQTLQALPAIITKLRAEGYELVTVTQMLGYRMIFQ